MPKRFHADVRDSVSSAVGLLGLGERSPPLGASVPSDSQRRESNGSIELPWEGATSLLFEFPVADVESSRCDFTVTEPNGWFCQYSNVRRLSRSGSGESHSPLTAPTLFPSLG